MRSKLHALFHLLAKPFRSRDPETAAHANEAELEIDEARRDARLEAQRRNSYLTQ